MVQQNFTLQLQILYVLLDRSLSIFSMTSHKQHMEYFSFGCYNQLDLPVRQLRLAKREGYRRCRCGGESEPETQSVDGALFGFRHAGSMEATIRISH